MSIQVVITANELTRTYTAAEPEGGVALSVSVQLPMLLRKERVAIVSRARVLLTAALDALEKDPA